MRTLQYCYFALKSITMSADDITDRLNLPPDEIMVMGSRSPERCLPRCHAWKIVRKSPECAEEQILHIVDRLRPVHAELVSLTADPEVSAVMQVVRHFHHEQGTADTLGWNLSLPVLDF